MAVGGTDAGEKIVPYYKIVESFYPFLADDPILYPDTPAGTFGLAWCYGINQVTGQPYFAVRDDIDVDLYPYIGFHESGHSFQNTIAWLKSKKNGTEWIDEFDIIRERYWAFRGFPGTWWDGQLKAIGGAGWGYYPDESFADAFAHVILMLHPYPWYVTGEWTINYGMYLDINGMLEFVNQLASEVEGDELDAEDKAVLREIRDNTKNTFDKTNALAVAIMTWLDRIQRGADVASGGADPNATKL